MTVDDLLFPPPAHDHAGCVRDALDRAEALCRGHGARLTDLRRRVLELVWSSHEPVGAYKLLDVLRDEGYRAQPPTVYRALDFLIEQGLVHRLERLNAFVGCSRPGAVHSGQFLICTRCGRVAELNEPGIGAAVEAGAARLGFTVSRQTVEAEGVCPDCRAKG